MNPEEATPDEFDAWLADARAAGPSAGFRELVMAVVRAQASAPRRIPRLAVAALLCVGLGLGLLRSGALCLWLLQSSLEAF